MKKLPLLLILICFLTACMTTKVPYHSQYGYADENPMAYNSAKQYCTQVALKTFPYAPPPQYQQVPQNLPRGGVGGAMAAGKIIADVENYNRMVSQQYNDYNNARDQMIHQCINQRGWYIIEKK